MARKPRKRKTDDEIAYGLEPEFTRKRQPNEYNSTLANALTWYRRVASDTDKKRWMIEWATENTNVQEATLKLVPEAFCGSYGAMCRVLERGFKAKGKDIQNLKDRIVSLAHSHGVEEAAEAVKPKLPPRIAKEQRLTPWYTTLDLFIDGVEKLLAQPSGTAKLNKTEVAELEDHYARQLADVEQNPKDYTDPKEQINRISQALEMVKAQGVVVKITRTRRKKLVTKDKQVAKLNFLNDTTEYGGLVSINPEKLIGATCAILFNVKYRNIQVYFSDEGLAVQGSTLKNFNGEKSYGKTVRVPEAFLKQLTVEKKSVKLVSEINAKAKPLTGRVNKDTIILKAW